MDFSKTKLSFGRSFTSYSKVQWVISSLVRGRPFHINRKAIAKKEYLDIGCGPNTHEAFINLDYGWRPGVDICWDLKQDLPLNDNTLKGVFTEHCLEHLPLEMADSVLQECFRLLRPGGVIRLVVPDGQLYLERYAQILNGDTDLPLPYSEGLNYSGIYSPILSVNTVFRAHGHLFIYDFDMLRQLLEKIGFSEIKKEAYQTGRTPELLLDTEHRAVESLYVEAIVPSSP